MILGTRKVLAYRLDTLCRLFRVYPDFVKVDAEGYEVSVILSAGDVLEHKCRFYVEVHNRANGEEITAILNKTHDVQIVRHPHYAVDSPDYFNHYYLVATN